MSNFDEDNPNFEDLDDLMTPGDDLAPLEPDMELPDELPVLEPVEIEDVPVEDEPAPPEQEGASESEADEQPLEKPAGLPSYMGLAGAVAGAVIVLALVFLQFIYFGMAIYAISVGLVLYGIWKERETNTVYTALLGCALIAVLTAVYCLWIELGRYQFDISAKRQASVSSSSRFDHIG